ncbi:MAG: hypothetical protein J6K58_13305 [Lachnospiraceae bacterium]|nr:hypothetical protein [Lachnospiraceae bacterium]
MSGLKRYKKRILFFISLVCLLLTGCQKEITEQEESISDNSFLDSENEFSEKERTGQFLSESETSLSENMLSEAPYAIAYYQFLEKYADDSSAQFVKPRFYLAFIDDDEIPELLIMDDYGHAAGVKVYTYDDDIVEIGEFGSMGSMSYVQKEGLISSSFTGMGEFIDNIYEMEDGEASLIHSRHSYPDLSQDDPYTNLLYEVDEIPVSKEEYDEDWQELWANYEWIYIGYDDGIPMDEASLKTSLFDLIDKIELKRGSEALQMQVSGQADVLKAYKSFLDDYVKGWEDYAGEGEGPRFSLIYLDHDTIPELVIFDYQAHASCAKIYTYENGETVHIGEYGEYGGAGYIEREGIIFSDYDSGGNIYTTIYQIDGTKETKLQSFSQLWDFNSETEEETWTYFLDGEEVSKEQYDEADSAWDQYGENRKSVTYDKSSQIRDADMDEALTKALEDLILGQKTALQSRLLVMSGAKEDEIIRFEYDDLDRDGTYEAFAFLGQCEEDENESLYSGSLWFVGTDSCVQLAEGDYCLIDGKMSLGRGLGYIYLNNVESPEIVKSEIWTVENGKPVESPVSGMGELTCDSYYGRILAIWMDEEDHYYDPEKDLWSGHIYKPCFYRYGWTSNEFEKCQGEEISWLLLKQSCGFDMVAEIEAEGYEVSSIIKWDNGIITVNYMIPPKGDETVIQYENVIWDSYVKDYWRKEERGVTSWKDAGVGGTFRQ